MHSQVLLWRKYSDSVDFVARIKFQFVTIPWWGWFHLPLSLGPFGKLRCEGFAVVAARSIIFLYCRYLQEFIMRLTLRTLLSYRDGVLAPKENAILESKLKESLTARQISQRIDQSLKNPKLAPIPVDAKEPGFDANQIAEYLDDTIPTDQIPELERRCLENNALLSEVGSCHSILTRALANSVEIPDSLRERIYSLPSQPYLGASHLRIERVEGAPKQVRFDAAPMDNSGPALASESSPERSPSSSLRSTNANAHSSGSGGGESGDVPAAKSHESGQHPDPSTLNRSKMESLDKASVRTSWVEPRARGIELSDGLGSQVPEYLLGSDRSWLRSMALAGALCIAVVVVGLISIGPLDRIGAMLAPSPIASNDDLATVSDDKKQTPNGAASKGKGPAAPITPLPIPKRSSSLPNSGDNENAANVAAPKQVDAPKSAVASSDSPELTLSNHSENPTQPATNTPDRSESASSSKESLPQEGADETRSSALQWSPTDEGAKPALVLFRTISSDADSEDQNRPWKVADSSKALGQSEWIVPAFQRTEFTTHDGDRMQVCDESHLRSRATTDVSTNNLPPVELLYGQIIVFPKSQSSRIHTPLGTVDIAVNGEPMKCVYAIVAGYRWEEWKTQKATEAGTTPQPSVSPHLQLICVQGNIGVSFQPSGKDPSKRQEMSVGDQMIWGNAQQEVVAQQEGVVSPLPKLPEWLKENTVRQTDKFAIQDVSKLLRKEGVGNLMDELRNLTKNRSTQNAAFANRVLFQLGDFSNIYGANGLLTKSGLFTYSGTWLNKIPNYLNSKQRVSDFLRNFVEGSEGRAETLLRLLIPFSNEQLSEGGDKLLVESLSSPHLDERILSIVQLTSVTGKSLGYSPERSASDVIQAWRGLQAKDAIRYPETRPFE